MTSTLFVGVIKSVQEIAVNVTAFIATVKNSHQNATLDRKKPEMSSKKIARGCHQTEEGRE